MPSPHTSIPSVHRSPGQGWSNRKWEEQIARQVAGLHAMDGSIEVNHGPGGPGLRARGAGTIPHVEIISGSGKTYVVQVYNDGLSTDTGADKSTTTLGTLICRVISASATIPAGTILAAKKVSGHYEPLDPPRWL